MSDLSNPYSYDDRIDRLFEGASSPSRSHSKFGESHKSFHESHEKVSYHKNTDGSPKNRRRYYDLPDSRGEAKVSDLKNRLAAKDVFLQEMKEELESYKERSARQASHIQSLKDRIKEFEYVTTEKSEINAEKYSLKRENKELNDRIKELENRVRIHLIEREKAEQKCSNMGKRLQESVERLSFCLNTNVEDKEDSLNVLVTKVEKLIKEYSLQKSRITSLEDALASHQVEFKASRDTIVKLVSEAEKHKKAITDFPVELISLKRERDEAFQAKKSVEREKEILQEKLKDNHIEWGNLRQELMEKDRKINEMDRTLRTSDYEAKASHSLHHSFISQLATMLSNGFTAVPGKEEAVKQKIQELTSSEHTWKTTCEELQQKVLKLSKQLEQQRELYHEAMSKSYTAEELLQEHEGSLKHLKGKLASEEMIKDSFNIERKKFKKFLLQLAEKLKINQDMSSESLVSQYDMLLNRAEDICKRDKEFLSDNKPLIYNLQKKVNSLKEKLELKSSQMEQLQKKIKQLERENEHQAFLSAENAETMTAQKLQKKVERLQGQLSDMKIANQNLTAQLVDLNALKEKINQQKKTIELLSKSLENLEKIKEKAAKKVVSLKTELDYTEHETVGEKLRSQQMVEAVTNELRTTKRALEEVARREKQLVDFRETITRMMGYNLNTLAVPDHEIFDQLKRVLRTQGSIDVSRTDRTKLPYGFRTGDGEMEYTVQHMNPRFQ
ncbi:coiled-coil domain-containing protein 170-like isoform X2 [Pseudophryne corroboree]|uniref:coiled-coil domain-containing protein 170-like isoform X2 n=1 Tax=Pseudophryne corroboree TaxID=495146 RepID=UPI003081C3B3